MALTPDSLSEVRQALQASNTPADRTKTQINAAIDAVDNYFETTARAGINTVIEAATPGVFTAGQKLKLVKFWLLSKYRIS